MTYHYNIAGINSADLAALLFNDANKLMARNKPGWNCLVAAIPVQVAAAQGSDFDLENNIGRMKDLRLRTILNSYLPNAFEDHCAHCV